MQHITHLDYLNVLKPWIRAAKHYIYVPPDRQDIACYGTGYNSWGVQTNQKAFAALAVLAEEFDEEVLEDTLRLLRFSLESHIEGSYHCLDGTKWGHTWISALGIERMMHGVEAIESYLTVQDRQLLRKVMISECDWLLDHYEIVADPDQATGKNRPESNLWNGSILHRTAMMYPDAARVNQYQEKGNKFLMNAISVPSDAFLQDVIEGKAVSEWHVGANFFETYALNHHLYLNVGYMVICLSNVAMLHFSYRKQGIKPPDTLYHHVRELWSLVKHFTFPDGRLLQIGGDTRVRYCYCQDYVIPMWLMVEDLFADSNIRGFEEGWLNLVATEMDHNKDGTFLSDRCSSFIQASPIYYTRLESDRAVTLSMGAYWRKHIPSLTDKETSVDRPSETDPYRVKAFEWSDSFHGACFHRSTRRIASWTWIAAEKPQGLCLPPHASDMAEWRWNMVGRTKGLGTRNDLEILSHRESPFPGGFITSGHMLAYSEGLIMERQFQDDLATQHVAFAALPDDATVVVMQYAESLQRRYLSSVKGLFLQIPNDLFNGNRRVYYSSAGSFERNGPGDQEELIDVASTWINVEDEMGVHAIYGQGKLQVYRPNQRQIGIKKVENPDQYGMLYADEICYPCELKPMSTDPGQVLLDLGFLVRAQEDHIATHAYANLRKARSLRVIPEGKVRAMLITGANGKSFVMIANFEMDSVTVSVQLGNDGKLINLSTSDEILMENGQFICCLDQSDAKLYEFKL